MINKLTFLLTKRVTWSLNDDVDICIYSKIGSKHIVDCIEGKTYSIIDIDKYIYLKYFFRIPIRSFFKLCLNTLYIEYLKQIITSINPKILITVIDNCKYFQSLDKHFHNQIKVLTIQNGNRFFAKIKDIPDYHCNDGYFYNENDKIFHSNLLCYSQYEIDQYRINKANVLNFHPIGPIYSSDYFKAFKKRKKRFDICFITGGHLDRDTKHKAWEYLKKLAEENDIAICIALKYNHHCRNFSKNIEIIEDFFSGTPVMVIPHSNNCMPAKIQIGKIVSTYYLSDISELTMGFASSALRESFARGNKIYPINFETENTYGVLSKLNLNMRPTYDEFKENIKELINFDEKKYQNINQELMKYFCVFDPKHLPKSKLKEIIENSIS